MRQPSLQNLVACVQAPTVAMSGSDGQIRERGVHGVLHADVRVLSRAELLVGGVEPEPLAGGMDAGPTARFTAVVRSLGDPGSDPTVRVDRLRCVHAGGMEEQIRLTSTAAGPLSTDITVVVAVDLAPVEVIRSGAAHPRPLPPDSTGLRWSDGTVEVLIDAPGAVLVDAPGTVLAEAPGAVLGEAPGAVPAAATAGSSGPGDAADGVIRLRWPVELPGRGERVLRWRLEARDRAPAVVAPGPDPAAVAGDGTGAASGLARLAGWPGARAGWHPPGWSRPRVAAADPRLLALLERALADLDGLRLAIPGRPGETFLGAGVPWYLTLFGRDSLWAARMMLPLGTALAGSTLRTLAARQGRHRVPATAEAPGKILHELRRANLQPWVNAHGGGELRLPPLYYGTVDATPLWVCLLHDAWRWGMPEAEVAALLPHAEAALDWMAGDGDPDGDGFLEYVDQTGHGLANQGWKDSADAVRFADGSRAAPPVALCEVQGYAHEAARHGADLLDAFGRPGGQRWRQWAAELAGKFRERFWVDTPGGRYPALALDAAKRPADTVTSNIGHLLGTGLLDEEETALVAHRVTAPDMDSGYGLRTMSADAVAYSPLSYHCGSVWPHDTAIVLHGLARTGHGDLAGRLVDGLLAAGAAFGHRLPELYAGDGRDQGPRPVPYPSACRPQAWSAAAAVTVLQALLGLEADVPSGRMLVRPIRPQPAGALAVSGLVAGGHPLRFEVDGAGALEHAATGPLRAVESVPLGHTALRGRR
jgi:hypothetical protein